MVFTKVDAAQQCKKKKNHKEPFPVPLEKQQEIFKSTNKTPNNIEYVGCGYDMYNRSGIDDQTGFSLKNYRAPVLDYYTLETNTDDQNYGKLGLWWSNEYVCDLSQELTTVKTKQDLKSLITSHTNEGYSNVFDSYSKDVNTTDDIYNKLKRSRNVLVRKYRCTVYSAGLIYNTRRMNTKRFDEIVNKLVDLCEGGFRDDNCPVEKYERNMDDEGCDGCITSWMRFFADFGTHLTIRLSMGGIFRRFTNVSQKKAMRDASKKETTTTFSSTWFGLSTSTTSNARKSDSKISRENKEDDIAQYTVGPEPHNQSMTPEVFEQWVRNVGLNPVPIDVEFSPLSEIMASNEAKKLYNEALKYYAKLKGVDHTEFLRTEIFKSPIVHLLITMALFEAMLICTFIVINDAMGKDKKSQLNRTNQQGRIPAMEYLGCGYDILFGNPLADDGSLVDPGYRNPIISFTLVQYKGKTRKDLKYANIPGAWIRPLVSCKRSTENTIVKSMNDYQKALSVDSEVGLGTVDESVKFALSAGYSESSGLNLSTTRRLHIQRNYCFLLEAALPVNGKHAFKKSFKIAMRELSPDFRKGTESCSTIRYAMNPEHPDCLEHVAPWMKLFEMFGTHFSYNVKIGGRLTQIAQVNKSSENRNSTRDIKAGAGLQVRDGILGSSAGITLSKGSKRSNVENISFSYTNVLGGRTIGNIDDEDEYLAWIQSIPDHPMPIRSQLAPLSKLFDSDDLREAYDDAMEFYVELNGLKTSQKNSNIS
ncbi:MAC Perforin domain containing protein, putative [Babesia ovis]|uniref:MAC Perforin domain containing protein, putative n=1 Tax=Babesia ovis TaxID=5869 RepID=A0A9W5T7I4_BABOV|nr:MAC Perforin domain containing protein, putative [Babesia ovis]